MATFQIFPVFQILDSNGDPVSGAKLTFFEPGTTTPKTVYSDTNLSVAHPSPLVASAGGFVDPVYIGGASGVKVSATDASDTLLEGYPRDNVNGIPVGGLDAASVPFTATARISADDTQEAIETVDLGVQHLSERDKILLTGGSANAYTITTGLTDYTAYAAGDAFVVRFHAANTTGASTINVDGLGAKSIRNTINGSTQDPAGGDLDPQAIVRIVYDGTNFIIIGNTLRRATGAEAAAGTETAVYMDPARTASAINALAPRTEIVHVRDEKAANTAGGATVATTWTAHIINTVVLNEVTGASLSSNRVTLPAGDYEVDYAVAASSVDMHTRVRDITGSATLLDGVPMRETSDFSNGMNRTLGKFTLSVSSAIEIQYFAGGVVAAGLGRALNLGSVPEVYLDAVFRKIN